MIDKAYAKILENKKSVFVDQTKTKKQIFIAIISANGMKENAYSQELIDDLVTLDDLFATE